MTLIDKGGSIAIKGFNYQKASAILVMIYNFDKDGFKVIPESREDFEVHVDDKSYFIQVKGTRGLSVSNMKSRPKGKESIIEKNLTPGKGEDIRKIFLWDVIDKTKKELIKKKGTLISDVFIFSDEQKEEIKKDLSLDTNQISRMNNQYIFITPFTNDLTLAIMYLKGVMVDENLLVNNERAKAILGELSLEIDQKSELIVDSTIDLEKKEINNEYLKKLFIKVQQMELFDEILKSLSINSLMKKEVEKVKVRTPFLYQSVKIELKKKVDYNKLILLSNDDAINELRTSLSLLEPKITEPEVSIAIAIDVMCDLGSDN